MNQTPIDQLTDEIRQTEMFHLNREVFGDAVADLLLHFLEQEELLVHGAILVDHDTHQIHVSGFADNLQGETMVPMSLSLIEDNTSPSTERNLIFSWTPGRPFPDWINLHAGTDGSAKEMMDGTLDGGPWSQVVFEPEETPKIIFSSFPGAVSASELNNDPNQYHQSFSLEELKQGLSFKVKANWAGVIKEGLSVLGASPEIHLSGQVISGSSQDEFVLSSPLSSHYSQAGLGITLSEIRLSLPAAQLGAQYPTFSLLSTIHLGAVTLHCGFSLNTATSAFKLGVSSSQTALPGLNLIEQATNTTAMGDFFPVETSGLGNFELNQFLIEGTLYPFAFTAIQLVVSADTAMELIPGVISVKPALQMRMRNPFDSQKRSLRAGLSGIWTLGTTDFYTSIQYPGYTFQVQMLAGQSLDATAALNHLLPGVDFPDIDLSDLEVYGSFSQKAFAASIEVATDWKLDILGTEFGINEVGVELEYANQKVESLEINGNLTFLNTLFTVVANYEETSGWLLSATSLPNETLDLGNLITQTANSFSGLTSDHQAIPSDYLHLGLRDFYLEYEVSPKKFTFYSSLADPLVLGNGFSIDRVFIKMAFSPGSMRVTSLLRLKIAKVDLLLESTYENGNWLFKGSAAQETPLPIGELVDELAGAFGFDTGHPALLDGLNISNLHVEYHHPSHDFVFGFDTEFDLGPRKMQTRLELRVEHQPKTGGGLEAHKRFTGNFILGEYRFDILFDQDPATRAFLAVFHEEGGTEVSVRNLIGELDEELESLIPAGLSINLKDILFAFVSSQSQSKSVFALDIGTQLNLSNLPLVGKEFPPDQTLAVDDLQLAFASDPLTQTDLDKVNQILPTGLPPILGNGLTKGLSLNANLTLGDQNLLLNLDLDGSGEPVNGGGIGNGSPGSGGTGAPTGTASTGKIKWFNLNKKFGPVYFQRVGVSYQNAALWFLLDGVITAQGLELTLQGLAAGSPIDHFDPRFALRGLGLDYRKDQLEIGGAFLREPGSSGEDTYNGAAVIRTSEWSLAALGSYAKVQGHPSLFVYGFLEYPLGGPPFFFVEGLAAGFGYNRSLQTPPIDQVRNFPLVEEAFKPTGTHSDLLTALNNLSRFIPPTPDEIFFSVGVKFTTFKLIDSFALISAKFGGRFELEIMGLAKAVVPAPEAGKSVTPLAEAEMAFLVDFIPDEGTLRVAARLTPESYILSRSCRLHGGYAFYSWFSGQHSGDFVQTLGGYHPRFRKPRHYPPVPRLGFNWRINSHLDVKGDAYYALTPTTLMAGGRLEATWHEGSLKAWFTAGADFLISWKPYHYEADIYVRMGVSYTFRVHLLVTTVTKTIRVHVGADLSIWGPEFSGKAHVHLWIVSFTVRFGGNASKAPPPINWNTFKTGFLPTGDYLSMSPATGLIQKNEVEGETWWVVNPKEFGIRTDSVVPAKSASIGTGGNATQLDTGGANSNFGISPLALAPEHLDSSLEITVLQTEIVGGGSRSAEEDFSFEPVFKNIPRALWGDKFRHDLNDQGLIDKVLTGFTIKPGIPPNPGETGIISRRNLQYDTLGEDSVWKWQGTPNASATPITQQDLSGSLNDSGLKQTGADLLTDLGFTGTQIFSDSYANALIDEARTQ